MRSILSCQRCGYRFKDSEISWSLLRDKDFRTEGCPECGSENIDIIGEKQMDLIKQYLKKCFFIFFFSFVFLCLLFGVVWLTVGNYFAMFIFSLLLSIFFWVSAGDYLRNRFLELDLQIEVHKKIREIKQRGKQRDTDSLIAYLKDFGRESMFGRKAEETLDRLGYQCIYQEEKGHWETFTRKCPENTCLYQDSQGTCLGSPASDNCYSSTEWVADVPRRVEIVKK
jgi:hypothetical protein